jgi:hypothetical protein
MKISPNNPMRETELIAFESLSRLHSASSTVFTKSDTEGSARQVNYGLDKK